MSGKQYPCCHAAIEFRPGNDLLYEDDLHILRFLKRKNSSSFMNYEKYVNKKNRSECTRLKAIKLIEWNESNNATAAVLPFG
jgi:hypothetical protein